MECKGCTGGIKMCYTRPCWGTPEDFDKIMDAGFGKLIQCDYYYRKAELGLEDIMILSMGLHWEKGQKKGDDAFSLLSALFKNVGKDRMSLNYVTDHTGGTRARINPTGKCVMLDDKNECLLHDMNLKPEQGMKACCKVDHQEKFENKYYASLWDTDKGKSVVEKWKQLVNYKEDE